ncbi:hypothetical protein ASE48_08320 [Mycobacterium sp. Root265]|uniref:DUF7257 domain-containing protein n=1 Tax=Mycobacterium sp. Root265 TaxID=1736504 RepID=UPI00070BE28E|nr:hypothetical protein [Mycobacterium sp. Root265]KRD08563.1 hypothetical protein ASE48_08320 [Mycobacterium sp. Root265]
MEYPGASVEAIDARGAFEIGGGTLAFGQDYNETIIRSMFTPKVPTPGNALGLLAAQLRAMPLEALQFFKDLIPNAIEGAFNTITGAVNAILGAIRNIPVFLQVDKWDDWLIGTWNTLERMVKQIIDIFTGLIITPINDAIQGVKDWFGSFVANAQATAVKAQSTINNILKGWREDKTATGSVEDLEVVFGEARQVKYGLITLADLANAPTNVPLWVSPNPFEEVAFPRSQLESVIAYSGGAANPQMATTSTTWNVTTRNQYNSHLHALTASYERPRFSIAPGVLALSAIRMTSNRIVNSARFIAGGDTPPTSVWAAIYEIDRATGNMTRLYDFGNIRSEIPTGPLLYEVGLEFDTAEIIATEGSILALGILPLGGSFTVAGVSRSQIVPSVVIYPQAATELLTGQTAMPSTILQSALTHDASFRMWGSIGQVVPETITPISVLSSFDAYSDTANWVSPAYSYRGNANFRITGGDLVCDGNAQLFAHDYWKHAFAIQAMATNDMYSEAIIGGAWSNQQFGQAINLFVRMSQDGLNGCAARVAQIGNNNQSAFVTISSMTAGVSTEQTISTEIFDALPTDQYRLEAVGNTYTVYRNGEPLTDAVWVDSTNIVSVGAAWRRIGFGHTAASWNNGVYRSAAIDIWRGGDIVIVDDPLPEEPEEPIDP